MLPLIASFFALTLAIPVQRQHTQVSVPPHGLNFDSFAANGSMIPITYNVGAPVLTGNVSLYLIYYGNWTDSQKATVEYFANNIGSSSWYNIERNYYYQASNSSQREYVSGSVQVAGTAIDSGSLGTSLNGTDIPDIIQGFIDNGTFPEDSSAIYYLLGSGDISETNSESSFCNDYCGYHYSWPLTSGTNIYYSFVGLPTACLFGCAPIQNQDFSPNGDVAVDAMLSVFAHELVEAISDPFVGNGGVIAWNDAAGAENGDKCGWTFGTVQNGTFGSYNMELGSKQFLIQQNWNPETQSCAQFA